MPLNLAPVNLAAGVTQNPLAQIGAALAALPAQQQQAQLQNQVIGKQMMQPYLNMIKANADYANDPSVMGPLNMLSKKYGIPIPYQAEDSPDATTGGSTQSTGQATPQAAPTGPTPAPGVTPTKPLPPGPGAAMSIGGPATAPPGGVATPPVPGVVPGAQPTPGSPAFQPPQQPQAPMVSQTTGAPIPGAPQPAQTPQQYAQQVTGQQMPDHTTPGGRRIAASFVGATLDPQTVLTLQQMQPDQRKAYLEATGVDPRWVPKSLLTEPVVMDPAQKVKVLDQINTDITKLQNAGNLTPSRLQELANTYETAGLIDPATAKALTQDPETLSQLGRGLQLKLQLLVQAGVLKQDQYDLAVKRLSTYQAGQGSLEDYRKFQEQFLGFKENYMTVSQQQTQERINNQTTEFATTAAQRDQLLEQGQDRLDHSDYATLAQDTRSAEANYNTLLSTYAQLDSTGKADVTNPPKNPDGTPAGPSFAQTMADALALKKKLEGQLAAANNGYRNPTGALKKQGVQTNDQTKQHPVPPGATKGTLPNGQHGYLYNGKLYTDNGLPYKQ